MQEKKDGFQTFKTSFDKAVVRLILIEKDIPVQDQVTRIEDRKVLLSEKYIKQLYQAYWHYRVIMTSRDGVRDMIKKVTKKYKCTYREYKLEQLSKIYTSTEFHMIGLDTVNEFNRSAYYVDKNNPLYNLIHHVNERTKTNYIQGQYQDIGINLGSKNLKKGGKILGNGVLKYNDFIERTRRSIKMSKDIENMQKCTLTLRLSGIPQKHWTFRCNEVKYMEKNDFFYNLVATCCEDVSM